MLKNIFVIQDNKSKTRDECLKFISEKSNEFGLILKKDITKLFDAFVKREKQSTTGFQDCIAIPHAQIAEIKESAVIITICKNDLVWESLDKKPIKTAIALLVPKDDVSSLHVDMLSKVSTLLLEDNFRKMLLSFDNASKIKKTINDEFNKLNTNVTTKSSSSNGYDVVGVSACATGVAHTYMAQEAIQKAAEKLGMKAKIETQGQKGPENVLTQDEIKNAKSVIIAADISVELDRFEGKKLLNVKTNDAISQPEKVINASLNSPVHNGSDQGSGFKTNSTEFKTKGVKVFMGHLLSGVSRMIPFIVFSGILWAIFNSVELALKDQIANNDAFKIAKAISEVGFGVFIAMMGAFIAESIAGRAAFAPGFIGTAVASNSSFYYWWDINGKGSGIPQIDSFFKPGPGQTELGISNVGLSLFGAIIMGFAAGYLVKWVNTWRVHKYVAPIMPIIFIPVVCSSVLAFPFIFLLSGPLGFLMNGLVFWMSEA